MPSCLLLELKLELSQAKDNAEKLKKRIEQVKTWKQNRETDNLVDALNIKYSNIIRRIKNLQSQITSVQVSVCLRSLRDMKKNESFISLEKN